MPHTCLPATAAACAAFQPMDTPVTPHTIAVPHPRLATSPPPGATDATPQIRAGLTPGTLTTQHKDLSPGKSINAQDPQCPINPTTPKLLLSKICLQTPHQILTVTLIL